MASGRPRGTGSVSPDTDRASTGPRMPKSISTAHRRAVRTEIRQESTARPYTLGHGPPPSRLASLPLAGGFGYDATDTVPDVVVVGSGLAGLVTARELVRRGISVVVLEAEQRLGGRVHTVTFDDGVTAEAHLEEFWEGNPAFPLLTELGLSLAGTPRTPAWSSTASCTRIPATATGTVPRRHLRPGGA